MAPPDLLDCRRPERERRQRGVLRHLGRAALTACIAWSVAAAVADAAPAQEPTWKERLGVVAQSVIRSRDPAPLRDFLERLAAVVDAETEVGTDARACYAVAVGLALDFGLWREAPARAELREHLERARRLPAEQYARDAAYLEVQWARHLQRAGRYEESIETLERFEREHPELAAVYPAQAEIKSESLRVLGRTEEALDVIGRALRDWPDGDPRGRAHLLGSRAQVYQDLGLLARMNADVRELETLAEQLGDRRMQLVAIVRRAELELARRRHDAVVRHVGRALESEWDAVSTAMLRVFLGVALADRQDLDAARSVLALALAEPKLNPSFRDRARRTLVDARIRTGELDFERDELGDAPESETLWTKALLARGAARAELEAQRPRQAGAFERMLDAWAETPRLRGGLGFLHFHERRAVVGELVRLQLALDDTVAGVERALAHVLRAQTMGSIARREQVAPVDLAVIRDRLLGPRRGVLVYLPTADRTHLFAFDRGRLRHVELAPGPDLKDAARELLGLLAASVGDAERAAHAARLEAASRELASALLPDEAVALLDGWRGVTVSGAGLLLNLPFEALVLPTGALLGESTAVDNLASLPLGVARMAEHAPVEKLDVALLAALRPGRAKVRAELRADSEVRPADAERLLGPYRRAGHTARALLEDACTSDAVRDALSEGTGVVQLLFHGVNDPRRRSVGLALREAVLWPDDWRALGATAGGGGGGVVVLSACGAAQSGLRAGDDDLVATLGGELARSGVHTVVTSRGDLAFGTHMKFLEVLHARLAAGDPVAEAARRARAAAAGDDRLESFRQAVVQVYGLGHAPLLRTGAAARARSR